VWDASYLSALEAWQFKLLTSLRRLCSQSGDAHRNTAQHLCRDRPRCDALVFRAAPASIIVYRLKKCLPWSASWMPPLGFQRLTPGLNVPYEHSNHANFTLKNEQNRQQGNDHRPGAGNPVLPMFMCPDGNCNHANPFRNGRGRNQSVSWAIQLRARLVKKLTLDYLT
jgi:hypothetical protein